jgi:GNAT superfamily N-acetyltransferase
MYTAMRVESDEMAERFCALSGLTPISSDMLHQHGADAHWLLAESDDTVARCSLWWSASPTYLDHRLGLIGHYAAANSAAAAALLRRACDELTAHGCTLAVGPMDGSTHQRYRLLTERGAEPSFFLEPDNPDEWPAHFTDNGFGVLARYCSALQSDLGARDPRLPAVERRLAGQGVRVRALDAARGEDELRRIYRVVAASFHDSFLYTPLAESDFLSQYRPILPCVVPELVLIAEYAEEPIGFLFVIPDWLQARRGQPVDTLILKTLAVLPDFAGRGLVGLLIARGLETARRLGYRRVIHALMHERNASLRLSGRFDGKIIRRYALFARPIGRQL